MKVQNPAIISGNQPVTPNNPPSPQTNSQPGALYGGLTTGFTNTESVSTSQESTFTYSPKAIALLLLQAWDMNSQQSDAARRQALADLRSQLQTALNNAKDAASAAQLAAFIEAGATITGAAIQLGYFAKSASTMKNAYQANATVPTGTKPIAVVQADEPMPNDLSEGVRPLQGENIPGQGVNAGDDAFNRARATSSKLQPRESEQVQPDSTQTGSTQTAQDPKVIGVKSNKLSSDEARHLAQLHMYFANVLGDVFKSLGTIAGAAQHYEAAKETAETDKAKALQNLIQQYVDSANSSLSSNFSNMTSMLQQIAEMLSSLAATDKQVAANTV